MSSKKKKSNKNKGKAASGQGSKAAGRQGNKAAGKSGAGSSAARQEVKAAGRQEDRAAGKQGNKAAGKSGAGSSAAKQEVKAAGKSGAAWKGGAATAGAGAPGRSFAGAVWADVAAAVPGVVMCCLALFMLAADLHTADMQVQYDLYPKAFKIADPVIAAACIICIYLKAAGKRSRAQLQNMLKADKSRWLLGIFLFLIFLSTCVNGFGTEAIHGLPYRNIGVFNMAAFLLLYMGASSLLRADRLRQLVLVLYAVTADLVAASALYNEYGSMIPAYQVKKELSAIFFNGNHYGYFLAMAVLIGLGFVLYANWWQMILGAVTAVLNAAVLALNHSMGCMLAVLVVTLCVSVYILFWQPKLRKRLLLVLAASAVLLLLTVNLVPEVYDEFTQLREDLGKILSGGAEGSEGHNRIKLWKKTWEYVLEKPLLGYGCEGMSERLYIATGISNPHNEVLTYAAYYGIPAALAYITGILYALTRWLKNIGNLEPGQVIAGMAAAGYFVSSLTGVAMFYVTPFFFIFLGLAAVQDNR